MDREVVIFIAYPLNPFTQVQSQQIRKEAVYGYSIKLPPGLLYSYYRTPNFSCFFQNVKDSHHWLDMKHNLLSFFYDASLFLHCPILSHKVIHQNSNYCIIYNSQGMEVTWCPSIYEWIKMWCLYTMEHYSVVKRMISCYLQQQHGWT